MTIQAWNIVLSAVILVLMTGGGLWLKYVVDQQLKSKDTAIQALEGVVKLKDAQIASLQGDTAPAITKAYATMREHANSVTEEFQKLSAQLADVTKKQQSAQESIEIKAIEGEAKGITIAYLIMEQSFQVVVSKELVNADVFEAYVNAAGKMNVERQELREKLVAFLKNTKQLSG